MRSGSPQHLRHEAWERFPGGASAPLVLTCEHASERVPAHWALPEADRWLVGTHWASDLGAARIARALAVIFRAPAVLSRFTRLLVDPNRSPESRDLVRTRAEGREIALNARVDDAELTRRLDAMYRPFHRAVDETVGACPEAMVVAVHTFTPVFEGRRRDVEVGVIFDRDEALARRCREVIAARGWVVGLNEPYSGRDGLMYSPHTHAVRHGRPALELEIRQDIATDGARRRRVLDALWAGLEALL